MNVGESIDLGCGLSWLGFCVFFLSGNAIFGVLTSLPPNHRVFHYLCFLVVSLSSLFYMCLALNYHQREEQGFGRAFMKARALEWLVVIPVLLTVLGRMARLTFTNLVAVVGFSVLWAFALLLATITEGPGRWAAYVYAIVLYFPLVYLLMEEFDKVKVRESSSEAAATLYPVIAYLFASCLLAYKVLWALGEGAGMLGQTMEMMMYLIIDLVSQSFICYLILSTRPYQLESGETRFSYSGRDYGTIQRDSARAL